MTQDYKKNLKPILVSIIPDLVGGKGHVFPYHHSVSKAAKLLGWEHRVAVPKEPIIKDLPEDWSACLSHEDLEAEANLWTKISKINGSLALGLSIANYLRQKILPKAKPTIIFMERFIHLQLLSLAIALWFIPRKNLVVWLLYRRDTHNTKTRFVYKILTKLIKIILAPGRLQLLTDSELLSQSLSSYFAEPIKVMPIPHTEINFAHELTPENTIITCCWLGPPRKEKGWSNVKRLVKTQSEFASKICLVASESANLSTVTNGINIKLIKDNLTRIEYDSWLCICDFILLPYDPEAYQERTSGIFTECIFAGKIPLVTPDTWMARELSKYSLDELIINWHKPKTILAKIVEIKNNLNIQNKLAKMQSEYQNFHNIEEYATRMQTIFKVCYT